MATEMEPQGEYDDSGLPGPGAPTPLSALEVRNDSHNIQEHRWDNLN